MANTYRSFNVQTTLKLPRASTKVKRLWQAEHLSGNAVVPLAYGAFELDPVRVIPSGALHAT